MNYTFDFADRQLSATPATGTAYVTSAKYRPFGPLEQIRYGNGTTKTLDYDNRYRPILNKLEKDSPLTTLATTRSPPTTWATSPRSRTSRTRPTTGPTATTTCTA